MANSIHDINLLPNKGEGMVNQFLNWALSIGRLLIILTETLALGTFIYRFSLDMKIVDLHDQIKAESFIVKNFKNSEDSFRSLQARLLLAKKYDSVSDRSPKIFSEVIETGRGRITFKNIMITEEIIKLEAQAPSSGVLTKFVADLKKNPAITGINIDKIENKTSSSMVVLGLTAQLKPSGLKKNIGIRPGLGSASKL